MAKKVKDKIDDNATAPQLSAMQQGNIAVAQERGRRLNSHLALVVKDGKELNRATALVDQAVEIAIKHITAGAEDLA